MSQVDEILADAQVDRRKTKLERWLDEHQAEGATYLEVMRRGLAEGRAFSHLHAAAQRALGGPSVSPQVAKPIVVRLLDAD
tara:strand:+ start:169 stop:411 length:243 start_codon:yes stop_codon:yes gene_type:complete